MAAVRYAVEEAVASLWRGRRAALLSIGTIAIALFVLGSFLLATTNLEQLAAEWRQAAELSVFLADDASDEDRRAVEAAIAADPLVAGHEFVSKAVALQRFKQMFEGLSQAADALDANPVPASYEVRLTPDAAAAAVDRLADRLRGTRGVADVRYDRQWLDRLMAAALVLRRIGLVLGAVLILAAALTVANVVRLALHARQDEIGIMDLVGAPTAYVRGPFIAEGILQGGLGSLVALVALLGAFLAARGPYLVPLASALNLSAIRFLPATTCLYLMLGGMLVGCAGGILATRSDNRH